MISVKPNRRATKYNSWKLNLIIIWLLFTSHIEEALSSPFYYAWFFFRRLKQKIMSSRQPSVVPPAQSTIVCDACNAEFDVAWYCTNCPASLCATCKQRHETDKLLRKHKVVKRSGSVIRTQGTKTLIQSCPHHPHKDKTGYCNDCRAPCCMLCIEDEHQRHAIIAIERKYMECEDRLNDMATKLEKQTLKDLVSNLEKLRIELKSREDKFGNVVDEVNRFRQELKEAVDKSCDKLVKEINDEQSKSVSEIKIAISDLEKETKVTEELIASISREIREGGMKLIEYIPEIPPNKAISVFDISKEPVLVNDQNLIEMISNNVGSLSFIEAMESRINIASLTSRKSPLVPVPSIHVSIVCDFKARFSGAAIAPAGEDCAWIAYDGVGSNLALYDRTGKEVRALSVGSNSVVRGVAVKRNGELIICYNDCKLSLETNNGSMPSQPVYV